MDLGRANRREKQIPNYKHQNTNKDQMSGKHQIASTKIQTRTKQLNRKFQTNSKEAKPQPFCLESWFPGLVPCHLPAGRLGPCLEFDSLSRVPVWNLLFCRLVLVCYLVLVIWCLILLWTLVLVTCRQAGRFSASPGDSLLPLPDVPV